MTYFDVIISLAAISIATVVAIIGLRFENAVIAALGFIPVLFAASIAVLSICQANNVSYISLTDGTVYDVSDKNINGMQHKNDSFIIIFDADGIEEEHKISETKVDYYEIERGILSTERRRYFPNEEAHDD